MVYPSIVLAFFGVAWSISGDQGLSVQQIAANVATNPLTYSMAFFGAIIWAVYCNYTQRVAKGQNAIVLFFIATAVTLWIKYALSDEPAMVMTTSAAIDLVLAGAAMGAGYALWNTAILGGNMVFSRNHVLLYANLRDAIFFNAAWPITHSHFLARRLHGDYWFIGVLVGNKRKADTESVG